MAEEGRASGSVGFGGPRSLGPPKAGMEGIGEKYVCRVRIANRWKFGESSATSPWCCQGSGGRGSP